MDSDVIFVKCGSCGALNKIPRNRMSDKPVCGKCKAKLEVSKGTLDHAIEATDGTFPNEVLSFSGAVLAEFHAPWCGACKMLAPTMDAIAKEYAGKLKVVKIDVDKNTMAASQFQIKSTPTLILFKDGKLINRMVGALPKYDIERNLKKLI